ncbi:hypothetical protein DFH06DRAFT_1380021 [Mycena polygramma]|nr:hypothetical protein DFH06DRAFT_1380021 [Mycena polygramma]
MSWEAQTVELKLGIPASGTRCPWTSVRCRLIRVLPVLRSRRCSRVPVGLTTLGSCARRVCALLPAWRALRGPPGAARAPTPPASASASASESESEEEDNKEEGEGATGKKKKRKGKLLQRLKEKLHVGHGHSHESEATEKPGAQRRSRLASLTAYDILHASYSSSSRIKSALRALHIYRIYMTVFIVKNYIQLTVYIAQGMGTLKRTQVLGFVHSWGENLLLKDIHGFDRAQFGWIDVIKVELLLWIGGEIGSPIYLLT